MGRRPEAERERKRMNVSIAAENEEWLQQYRRETDIPMSRLIDRAIDLLRKSVEEKRP